MFLWTSILVPDILCTRGTIPRPRLPAPSWHARLKALMPLFTTWLQPPSKTTSETGYTRILCSTNLNWKHKFIIWFMPVSLTVSSTRPVIFLNMVDIIGLAHSGPSALLAREWWASFARPHHPTRSIQLQWDRLFPALGMVMWLKPSQSDSSSLWPWWLVQEWACDQTRANKAE